MSYRCKRAEKTLKASDATHKENGLKESEALFQKFFEMAPDALVVTNSDGRIMRVNTQAEMMFGYSWDELRDRVMAMFSRQPLTEFTLKALALP